MQVDTNSVTVYKQDRGHFYLSHPQHGEFEAKRVAYGRRYRLWRRVQGVRGLKRGEVVIKEWLGDFNSLRYEIGTSAV